MAAPRYGRLKIGIAGVTAASVLLGMGYFQSQGVATAGAATVEPAPATTISQPATTAPVTSTQGSTPTAGASAASTVSAPVQTAPKTTARARTTRAS